MATRRELIILELEDNASAEALRAAAAFKTLDQAIGGVGKGSGSNRAVQNMRRDVDSLGSSLDRTGLSIDKFSGRAKLLGTAIMALGPSLIPIGAAAVPAIATLTAGMGAAAGAAGVLMLAFQGVGDAVSAMSDYRLDPSAANLAKVREEMEKIGPAGASFVMAIDEATPALRDLQMTAREGMFPGFERGLDEIMTQLPGVRNLIADVSTAVGNLGEAGADSLVNDADWQEFFSTIGSDGPQALENFGRATGNFVASVANLLEAVTGIGGGSSGMLETSQAFREWSANLENTEGFQRFADYVRESGPQVAAFLSSIGNAMLSLIEAAAPWGSAVLPALTAAADVFSAIASSPIGPALFAAAAGMLAFGKASALNTSIMGRVQPAIAKTRSSLGQLNADLKTVASGWVLASSATDAESKKYAAAQGRLKGIASEAAKAGPALAAMGLLATGTADKIGLSNTAMLGLAGSMAGPFGAAAGAAVGFTMDLATANDDLKASIEGANRALAGGSLETMTKQLADLRKQYDAVNTSDPSTFGERVGEIFSIDANMAALTGEAKKASVALKELESAKAGLENLAVALGANRGSAEEMASGADRAQQAMTALGISSKDLALAQQAGGVEFDLLSGRIQEWVASADSAAGRTAAVGDAIANLGNDAISAADSAAQLGAALDALIAPNMDLSAAQDAMSSILNGLKEKIDGTNKSLVGTSDAVLNNRAAIRDGVSAINDLVTAQGGVESKSIQVAQTLAVQRQALIDSGVAAGLSRGQVESYVNQLGLTPDVVRTAFQAAGVEEVDAKTQRLTARFHALPKRLRTDIATNGIPKSEADITRLQHKYKLTPAQVRTLAALQDNASGPIAAVIAALRAADGQTATTTIYHRTVNEVITIARGMSTRPDRRLEPGQHADGGEVMGQRYPYGDKVLSWLAPGEEVITNRNGEADRYRADRAAGRIPAYADGGTVGIPGYARGGTVTRTRNHLHSLERTGKRLEKALKGTEKAVDRAKDRLDYWNNRRDEVKKAVTGSLTRDWFGGGNDNVWAGQLMGGTAAYAQQQWRQQVYDSQKLTRTIANLRKNGAGDRFIEEILKSEDPLAAATMFNQQSKAGMRASQSLFLQARAATASAANSTSAIFADEQRKANKHLVGVRHDVTSLKKAINNNHKQAEATRKKYSAAKAAAKGSRAKKR